MNELSVASESRVRNLGAWGGIEKTPTSRANP